MQFAKKLPPNTSVENIARVYLYVSQCLSDDIFSQRRGLVSVSMPGKDYIKKMLPSSQNVDSEPLIDNASWRLAARRIMMALPIRIAAIHVVIPQPEMTDRIKALVLLSMGCQLRPRVRFHLGMQTECHRSLSKFGIPVDYLASCKAHQKWITMMQAKENMQHDFGSFPWIECPNTIDVVFGKGQMNQTHHGNRGMLKLIAQYYVRYNSASKVDKTCIAHLIHGDIEAEGGRFLKQHETLGYWTRVSKDEALKKIAMGFRDYRKKLAKCGNKEGAMEPCAASNRFRDVVEEALRERRRLV